MKTIIEVAGLEITDIVISKGTIQLEVRELEEHLKKSYEDYGFHIFEKKNGKSVIELESSVDPYRKKLGDE